MKQILGAFVVCVVLLMGCSGQPAEVIPTEIDPVESTPTESTPIESIPTEAEPTETTPTKVNPVEEVSESQGQNYTIKATPEPNAVVIGQQPPEDQTWISPGKVHIANFYPGARAEYSMTIHNGGSKEASFAVAYRYPDHVGEGYSKPTEEVQEWVIVADATPLLAPRETRNVLVVLEMPKDAVEALGPRWEFWVSVKDLSQDGMVQTELCSRWFVHMR